MPSDIHRLDGRKRYVETSDREGLVALVRKAYPGATAEGAVGAYSFHVGRTLVAEAWIHPTRPGWWLRVRQPEAPPRDVTNGEAAEMQLLGLFLRWMRSETLAIPETPDEAEMVLFRWLKACRKAALQQLFEQGKIPEAALKNLLRRIR